MKSENVGIFFVSFLTVVVGVHSSSQFPLHKAAFEGDITLLEKLLAAPECEASGKSGSELKYDVNSKDDHGNTPLHLAVMLDLINVARLLTEHGASVYIENLDALTPLRLALLTCAYDMIDVLLKADCNETKKKLEEMKPKKAKALKQIHDFSMELKMSFKLDAFSVKVPFPFASRVWKIYKRGGMVRMDVKTAFIDPSFDVSFIFNSEEPLIDKTILILDRSKKRYGFVQYNKPDKKFKRIKNKSKRIYNLHVNTNDVKLKEETGEPTKKVEKKYGMSNIPIKFRVRENVPLETKVRSNTVSWKQYNDAESTTYPKLENPMIVEMYNAAGRGNMAVTNNFPLTVQQILEVFGTIMHVELFKPLSDILTKLPTGEFPKSVQFPAARFFKKMYPHIPGIGNIFFIDVNMEFQNYIRGEIDGSVFEIPKNYEEKPNVVPKW